MTKVEEKTDSVEITPEKEINIQSDTDKLNKLRSAVWEFCHNLENFQASSATMQIINAVTNSPMYKDMKLYSKV